MHRETEIKLLGADVHSLRARLIELGAERKFAGVMREVAFAHPKLRIRKKGILLRLRTVAGRAELTLKKKSAGCKVLSRDEAEIAVSDFGETLEILLALGFVVCRDREKHREEWAWNDIKVEVDTYPGCPPYAEIEGKNPRAIEKAIKILGLGGCEQVAMTSTEVLRKVYKIPAEKVNFLKF